MNADELASLSGLGIQGGTDGSGGEGGMPTASPSSSKSLSEIAEENGFPYVTYDAMPVGGEIYTTEDGAVTILFDYWQSNQGKDIGTMTVNDRDMGQTFTFNMAPMGSSIFHLTDPMGSDTEGYVFVYNGARRILVSGYDPPLLLMLAGR